MSPEQSGHNDKKGKSKMETTNLGFGTPEEIAQKINSLGITSGIVIRDNDDEIDATGHPEDFKGCGYWV